MAGRLMKNKFLLTIKSTYLSIRYPFLYPRNRWTDLHYNNWKIIDKIKKLYAEAYVSGSKENGFKSICIDRWKAIHYHVLKWFHDNPLQWVHCIPTWNEWEAIEPGWKKAFGKQLLKELNAAMLEDGGRKYVRSVRILQIKEKWGRLQIYLSSYGKKTFEVINKYEDISWHTCIHCGRPAIGYTTGWIFPYCHVCYYEMKKKHDEGDYKYNLKSKWFKFFHEKDDEEIDEQESLESMNDEYTYGHNVERRDYSEDGD